MTTPKKEAPKEAPPTAAVQKRQDMEVEFKPFGSDDSIKLNIAMVRMFVAVKTKSGALPTDNDCIKFIALCKARRLNPYEGDAYLVGYDTQDGPKFNLITAHQAFAKRAECHEQFDGIESGVIVERDGRVADIEGDFMLEGDKLLGGWARVHLKNRKIPMTKRLSLKQRKPSFNSPFWAADKMAEQICKCAEADAMRASFPTVLGGMITREESVISEQATLTTKTPIFSAPAIDVGSTPEPQAKPLSAKDKLRVLCEESGISEEDLVDYLGTIELAEATDTKIDELSDESAEAAVDRWEDVADKIKEVLSRQ